MQGNPTARVSAATTCCPQALLPGVLALATGSMGTRSRQASQGWQDAHVDSRTAKIHLSTQPRKRRPPPNTIELRGPGVSLERPSVLTYLVSQGCGGHLIPKAQTFGKDLKSCPDTTGKGQT